MWAPLAAALLAAVLVARGDGADVHGLLRQGVMAGALEALEASGPICSGGYWTDCANKHPGCRLGFKKTRRLTYGDESGNPPTCFRGEHYECCPMTPTPRPTPRPKRTQQPTQCPVGMKYNSCGGCDKTCASREPPRICIKVGVARERRRKRGARSGGRPRGRA
jgi:hypothetical protein